MNNRLRKKGTSSQQNITINDVADRLGVSKTTISRAISGKGRIGVETREKVLSYIEEHGYRPNLIAKSLAESKTFNIAVALPSDTEVHEVPFFQTCLHSITETVTAREYDVVLSITSGQSIAGLKRLIRNQKVDGVILTRPLAGDTSVAYLKEAEVPFAVIGSCDDSSVVQVDSDHASGCREIMEHVIEGGSKKVILLAGNPDHRVNKDRYSGFLTALETAGKKVDENSIFWNLTANVRVEECLKAVMADKPDCLVCMDDVICLRVLSWLQRKGYAIPNDVKVVSFHDSAAMEHHHPPVTALHIKVRKLGEAAGTILLDMLEGKDVPMRKIVGYEVCIRGSSRSH